MTYLFYVSDSSVQIAWIFRDFFFNDFFTLYILKCTSSLILSWEHLTHICYKCIFLGIMPMGRELVKHLPPKSHKLAFSYKQTDKATNYCNEKLNTSKKYLILQNDSVSFLPEEKVFKF